MYFLKFPYCNSLASDDSAVAMKLKPLFALLTAVAAAPAAAVVYSSGHGDIGIAYEDEPGEPPEFFLHNHVSENAVVDGATGTEAEFAAGDLTIQVPTSTMTTFPTDAFAAGSGISSGGSVWVLPQSQSVAASQNAPYLGFATEELAVGEWSMITFTLGSVTLNGVVQQPGDESFSAWDFDASGAPNFFLSSVDAGETNNNTITLPAGGEAHFNLGFSAPGDWGIEFTVAGTNIIDSSIGPQTQTGTFNFSVVPEPSSALLAALGGLALMRRRRS